jgi:hypothetical protein
MTAFMMTAFIMVLCLGLACTPSSLTDRTSFDHEVANLDGFDPADYRALWNGDASLPDRPAAEISEREWTYLIQERADVGIRRMQNEERVRLLQGAIKAYLMSVESSRRRISAVDSSAASVVTEVYGQRDGLFTNLSAREEQSESSTSSWGDVLVSTPADTVLRAFVRDDYNSAEVWTEGSGRWDCEIEHGAMFELAFWGTEYYGNLTSIVLDGEPTAEREIAGRPVVQFELLIDNVLRVAWVDHQTLFPIAYLLPPSFSTGGEILSRRVEILGLNVDQIERPAESCS